MNSKEIIEAFNFRHACKIFDKNRKICEADFNTILESARLSPSSFGFEPWKFLVVQSPELRDKLLPITWGAQNILPTASHYVIILARKKPSMLYSSQYITDMLYSVHNIPKDKAEARRQKYKTFQEADFGLLEDDRYMFDWSAKQTYIALANMMSVAAMLGIDSCAVEGFELDKFNMLLKDDFRVDIDNFGVAVMAGFGYRLNKQPVKTRHRLEDIVEFF